MKTKLVPIIESIDENAVVETAQTVYRDCIMLVVKHPTEEKFLYLHNKKFGWNVLVQGGIEDGENEFVAAARELTEETGYRDVKLIKKLDFVMDNVYYAAHKKQNRYAIIKTFYIELNSLEQNEHEEESDILFENYEKLYDIFGAPFRHHYYLLGTAIGKQEVISGENESKLGNLDLVNHIVRYRDINKNPKG